MGQKVHPTGIRIGIIKDWTSTWYADTKNYAKYLKTDLQVREYLRKKLVNASVSRIQIERPPNEIKVIIHSARPGIVIGKKGEDIERLSQEVSDMMGVRAKVSVREIRKPELDASLVAESVAQQIERKIMFRRAMKRAVTNTMRLGALGIQDPRQRPPERRGNCPFGMVPGRRVPLHTLRADIDYGTANSNTTYGVIGVKVWIFKGEVFNVEDRGDDDAPVIGS